jgi:hypothetical protein
MITGGHIFVLCLILLLIYLLFNKSKREKYEYKKYPINVSWTNGDGTFSMVTKWIVVVVTPDGTEYTTETNSLEDRKDGSTVNLTVNDVVLKPGNNKITVKLLFDDLYGRKNIQFHKYEVEQIVYDDYENVVKIDNFEGCYEGEWTNNGSCSSEGKQTQTRALVGATCSDDLVAEREIDCCYQTEWVGNTCTPDGKIRQTREAAGNCDDLSTVREELDCCYQTEWVGNTCTPDGKIRQTREATGNCDDLSTEREIDCCYQTEWVGNTCASDGKIRQTREAAGNCSDLSTEREIDCDFYGPWIETDKCGNKGKLIENRTVTRGGNVIRTEERNGSTNCCYQTEWVGNTCTPDGKSRQTREVAGNCSDLSTEREVDCCYKSPWVDVDGVCSSTGYVKQTRQVVGVCTGNDARTEQDAGCFYYEPWAWGECTKYGVRSETRYVWWGGRRKYYEVRDVEECPYWDGSGPVKMF